jgi:hypothetical protein
MGIIGQCMYNKILVSIYIRGFIAVVYIYLVFAVEYPRCYFGDFDIALEVLET